MYLNILEVSRKQNYIFSRRHLLENVARSEDIVRVTSVEFFQQVAGILFDTEKNLVYSGGGHTVLQFDTREQAVAFNKTITLNVAQNYVGLELFTAIIEYNESLTPGENLLTLTAKLEEKKALRKGSFAIREYGVEKRDPETYEPVDTRHKPDLYQYIAAKYPTEFSKILEADKDRGPDKGNFLAIIHIDGNNMGARVRTIYQQDGSWEECKTRIRRFSDSVDQDFKSAFSEMTAVVEKDSASVGRTMLPLRPIILAGDDICFVCAGSIGLECARIFLEKLSVKVNREDKKTYSACAGVALVHEKYPFFRAYELAEELCNNAKKYGMTVRPDGSVSAMDWHIEFGEMKDGLADIRTSYQTEDGNQLELRPVTVVIPDIKKNEDRTGYRTYQYFTETVKKLQNDDKELARSKLKKLRSVLKQGELEAKYYCNFYKISSSQLSSELFVSCGDTGRCTIYDAIEMMDQCRFLEA